MDAIALLKQDHRTVDGLFSKFEDAGDRAYETKRGIVERIVEELSVHAAIEEQVFYPAVRREVDGAEDLTLESLEEHHIVKWVLSELDGMDPEAERYDAKVTVLMENVRHHVEEEEHELFPKVRDALTPRRLDELGEQLAEAKRRVPTKPHPRSPDTPPGNVIAGAAAGLVDKATDAVRGAVGDAISRVTGSGEDAADAVSETVDQAQRSAEKKVRRTTAKAAKATDRAVKKATSATRKTTKKATRKAKPTTAKRSSRATASKRSAAKRSVKKAPATTKRTASKAVTSTKRTARKAGSPAKRATRTGR